MQSNDLTTTIFGWAGMVTSTILTFIPIFMLVTMFKTKDNSRVTYLLFIVSLVNNFFWLIYGFIASSNPIIVSSGISGTANIVYLICFITSLDFSMPKRIMLILGLGLIASLSFFLSLFFLDVKDKQVYGTLAVIANCFLFIGPIQNIMSTFKEKDRSYIPIEIVASFIFSCFIWLVYGICLGNDINIIIPNVFGLLLMVFELCVWCYYYFNKGDDKSMKQKKADEDSLPNDQDNETNASEDKPFII